MRRVDCDTRSHTNLQKILSGGDGNSLMLRLNRYEQRHWAAKKGKNVMKSATFMSAIVLSAVAITGTTALAKGQGDREPVTFQQLDANGDGQVTKEEMQAYRTQRFTNADTNGDGQLSVEEMQAAAQKKANDRVTKMFEKHDANSDGYLSEDELPKPRRAGKMFDRIDADGNGSISEQEFADAKDKMGRHKKKRDNAGSDSN